jgi:glutathione S-transferase
VKAHACAGIEKIWERVDARLRKMPYIAGNNLSAVDFHATMLMRWSRDMPKAADQWDAIAGYLERMKALKSFGLVHEREGLQIWPSVRSLAKSGRTA